jgi:hypothetical protein
LALNEARHHLYVATRLDNAISVIQTQSRREIQHVPLFNPEPPAVVAGRRFLYDASFTSSHGDSACATCHVFGDFDSLAWDLGNPDETTVVNANPLTVDLLFFPADPSFLPMKGPLTTQSLRGLANHGPMHWRGDRTGASDAATAQPDGGAFDEVAAFRKFQAGFVDLLGRHEPLPDADMQAFTDFILQVMYPPNPVRHLDNSLTPKQAAGRAIFFDRTIAAGVSTCVGCHSLDPRANAALGPGIPGFFGSDGRSSRTGGRPQMIKVPHLRNMYQKVGMFGFPDLINFPFVVSPVAGLSGFMGDQVRGFGFLSAGDFDTIVRFHNVLQFDRAFPFGLNPHGFAHGEAGNFERRQVEAFLLAFDTNHAPIVGQQVTLNSASGLRTHRRIDLLMARAEAGECDLVVKVGEGAAARGYLYEGAGTFTPDKASSPTIADFWLRVFAVFPRQETTYTCVPVGSGGASGSIAIWTACWTRTNGVVFSRSRTRRGRRPTPRRRLRETRLCRQFAGAPGSDGDRQTGDSGRRAGAAGGRIRRPEPRRSPRRRRPASSVGRGRRAEGQRDRASGAQRSTKRCSWWTSPVRL